MSELLPIEGIDVIGPLPPEVQQLSILASGVPASAGDVEGSSALVAFLRSSAVHADLARAGLGALAGDPA